MQHDPIREEAGRLRKAAKQVCDEDFTVAGEFAGSIRRTVGIEGNPYATIALLIEAVVFAVVQEIPNARQPDTAKASVEILLERFQRRKASQPV